MPILRDILLKIKGFPRLLKGDGFIIIVIILVACASFGLGRLSMFYGQKGALEIVYPEENGAEEQTGLVLGAEATGGQYVASKSGSKYHFPWCAGAQSIKEENKIWFDSKEEAMAAGYAPAANCKGL